jgi:DNA repair photolyase
VRWDNLTVEADDQARLPGYRDGAVVRRFDVPEAMDTRFYEVHAKSALNRVPESSQVPFRWTINPYRGCSHACTYCLGGDTPILMADGSVRRMADLQVGDAIYGTVGEGARRRYAVTRVVDHWSTVKPAYRVRLDDGTELIASGDHRFLSDHGWKHVIALQQGRSRRPHLMAHDRLLGPGRSGQGDDLAASGAVGAAGALAGVALTPAGARRVAAIESLRVSMRLFDMTTETGDFIAAGIVSHNCFARPTHKYLDFDAGRDFEREIVVKVNVPEVLRAELRRRSWKGEHVAMGTNTDPYQWVEGRYRLMPGIWEALRDARNPCSVLTKSPLVLRDLDLLREIAEVTDVSANFSVPTLDEKAWRASEPHTPHPRARLEAVGELTRAGIPCGILVAPLMPGINDQPGQVERILELAAEHGATGVSGIALHLRGDVRRVFMDWLRSYRPDLVPRYEELYGRGGYAPKAERERLMGLVRTGKVPTWPSPRHDHRGVRRRGGAGDARGERSEEVQPPVQQALF